MMLTKLAPTIALILAAVGALSLLIASGVVVSGDTQGTRYLGAGSTRDALDGFLIAIACGVTLGIVAEIRRNLWVIQSPDAKGSDE